MEYFTTSDGLRLAFQDQGMGLPVLCLAGLTRNSTDFDYVAPHLSGVRMIRMDYRGRGQSAWADPMTYSIPIEARDALELLDHLGLEKVAILGTSRGGLIAMVLAATARERLIGVCLNDIGPDIKTDGLEVIMSYVGRNPRFKTRAEMAAAMPGVMVGFANVPQERWAQEVAHHTIETADGLTINYDPRLRDAVVGMGHQPAPDLWPMFDALRGLPVALIRGANSDLLSPATVKEMQRRHPDMMFAQVPDRAHIPFLDEAESLSVISKWLESCQ